MADDDVEVAVAVEVGHRDAVARLVVDADVDGHGLEGVLPVDIYLPGCPPNPAAIIEALLLLLDRKPQRVQRGQYAE